MIYILWSRSIKYSSIYSHFMQQKHNVPRYEPDKQQGRMLHGSAQDAVNKCWLNLVTGNKSQWPLYQMPR